MAAGADKDARDNNGRSALICVSIDLMDKNCPWLLRVLLFTRAIFISNNFFYLNVSVHNGTFIRKVLPYQIERQFIQQLILTKSKKKKKNDENTKWFICMGKSRENSSQLYPGFLHNYLFYNLVFETVHSIDVN